MSKRNQILRPAKDANGRTIGIGDVVTMREQEGVGGVVLAVVGNAVVYRRPEGIIESWDEPDGLAVLASGPRGGAPPLPVLADQFADATSVDASGQPIRIGGRVEYLNSHGAGVVVAVAGNAVLTLCDYADGDVADGAFMYHNAGELRVVPDVSATLEAFVRAKRSKGESAA